jgi:hypothetical protein
MVRTKKLLEDIVRSHLEAVITADANQPNQLSAILDAHSLVSTSVSCIWRYAFASRDWSLRSLENS